MVFNAVVKLATQYRDIESAHEETRRASWEDSMLHVQNMVLDNCLSTIKHETIYYPNKIKQIIGRLNTQNLPEKDEREAVETITELIEYYKGIFYDSEFMRCPTAGGGYFPPEYDSGTGAF